MRKLAWILSMAGLALNVVPAFLVFSGTIKWPTHATLMLVGTLLWFVTAPVWIRDRSEGPGP